MKFTSSQPSRAHCNSTIIYFYQREQNLTQFIKVLLVKLSDMLHLSNFVRLFHHQSFMLYSIINDGNGHNKSLDGMQLETKLVLCGKHLAVAYLYTHITN